MNLQRTPPGTSSTKVIGCDNDSSDNDNSTSVGKRPNKRPAINSPPMANSPEDSSDVTEPLRRIVEEVVQKEMSTLLTKLNLSMSTLLNTQLKSIKDELQEVKESMTFMNNQYEEITKEIKASKKCIKELQAKSEDLEPRIDDINYRLNQVEQTARSNNIEIQCLPERKNENLVEIISQLGKKIDYNIPQENIAHCSRTAKINRDGSRPRAIVVRFNSPRTRDHILAAVINFNKANPRDKLNSSHFGFTGMKTPVFVSEHLSPSNKALHAATRQKAKEKGFKYVWVRNGKIFVRKDEQASSIIVKNKDTLLKLQ